MRAPAALADVAPAVLIEAKEAPKAACCRISRFWVGYLRITGHIGSTLVSLWKSLSKRGLECLRATQRKGGL
jgi:hypothetical protein